LVYVQTLAEPFA